MAGRFAQAFKGQRKKLIEMINVENPLLDELLDTGIINSYEVKSIKSQPTPYDRGHQLLNYLERCSDKKFDQFCEILAVEREDAVRMMSANLQSSPGCNKVPEKTQLETSTDLPAAAAAADKRAVSTAREKFDERWSNETLKIAFKKLQPTIIATLDVHDVIDELFAADIVEVKVVEELSSGEQNHNTVRRLLLILHGCDNPQAFTVLRRALWSRTNKQKYSSMVADIEERCMEIDSSKRVTSEQSSNLQEDDPAPSAVHVRGKKLQLFEPAIGEDRGQDTSATSVSEVTLQGVKSEGPELASAAAAVIATPYNESTSTGSRPTATSGKGQGHALESFSAGEVTQQNVASGGRELSAAVHIPMPLCKVSPSTVSRSTASSVTHVITVSEYRRGDVAGLTVLGDELFIVRDWQLDQSVIEVYNATNFAFKRTIDVVERVPDGIYSYNTSGIYYYGLTSCDINECLYVSYGHSRLGGWIARVEMTGDNKVVNWKVKDDYVSQGLSVNSEQNLMVACSLGRSNKLIEYTTRGRLVREIRLQGDVVSLRHAIQLNSNQFLVSHGYEYSLHRVCVVDANGRVLLSYGNKSGSKTGQLHAPRNLAIDRNGFIFVADLCNERIVVLDSTLKWSRDLKISNDDGGGVKSPHSLYLNEQRNLLFIGDRNGYEARVVSVTV